MIVDRLFGVYWWFKPRVLWLKLEAVRIFAEHGTLEHVNRDFTNHDFTIPLFPPRTSGYWFVLIPVYSRLRGAQARGELPV